MTDWIVERTWGKIQQRSSYSLFLQETLVLSSGMGMDVHSLMLSIQHFLCWPRRRPPWCPERWFGEAVVACNMPEPCKFPSIDSCQKRFLWTHKEVDLALHPDVGLVLQVEDVEKFHRAFGSEGLGPLHRVKQAGSMFHSHRVGWSDKRLIELEFACKADGIAPPDSA